MHALQLPVHARLVHLTVGQTNGSDVRPGAGKYQIFRSDAIAHVDLSTIGVVNPEANDSVSSILQVCTELEVGVVKVINCPGFDFEYFAREGWDELRRLKAFFGNVAFPFVGYAASTMDADFTHYSLYQHDIRAAYLEWRLGVQRAVMARHVHARHLLLNLKDYYLQVLHLSPGHGWRRQLIGLYRKLYAGGKMPSTKRAKSMATFVKHVPRSALLTLTCSNTDKVLTAVVLDQPWMHAAFPEEVACKLIRGLNLSHMKDAYFVTLFNAYKDAQPSVEQRLTISQFERELFGEKWTFSEEGVATGKPCSPFDLFCECANVSADENQDEGTLGDHWLGLGPKLRGVYEAVAHTISAGSHIQAL